MCSVWKVKKMQFSTALSYFYGYYLLRKLCDTVSWNTRDTLNNDCTLGGHCVSAYTRREYFLFADVLYAVLIAQSRQATDSSESLNCVRVYEKRLRTTIIPNILISVLLFRKLRKRKIYIFSIFIFSHRKNKGFLNLCSKCNLLHNLCDYSFLNILIEENILINF